MKIIRIIIMCMLIFTFLIEVPIIIVSLKNQYSTSKNIKYIIVLGAKLNGKKPSKSLLFRMEKALYYMKNDENLTLIASGGQGKDELIPEAQAIKNYLLKNGIDEKRIIVEDKSTNTFENMAFSRKKILEKGTVGLYVVSNDYHILRAKILAKRNNFIPYGIPAKTPNSVFIISYAREGLALIKSYLFDK